MLQQPKEQMRRGFSVRGLESSTVEATHTQKSTYSTFSAAKPPKTQSPACQTAGGAFSAKHAARKTTNSRTNSVSMILPPNDFAADFDCRGGIC